MKTNGKKIIKSELKEKPVQYSSVNYMYYVIDS